MNMTADARLECSGTVLLPYEFESPSESIWDMAAGTGKVVGGVLGLGKQTASGCLSV